MSPNKRIPVILDTDIGSDIDDMWALAMALKCPELDLKLVVSDHDDAAHRALIAARTLEIAQRTDVNVGIGVRRQANLKTRNQADWVKGYDLKNYPGRVHEDGVGAMIETIMSSKEEITLLCIGPMQNVGAALDREPRIASRARFVGMYGSIAWSHRLDHAPIAENNVIHDVVSCRKAFAAPWEKTITPLDTCGKVRLSGDRYRRVSESADPLTRAVIEGYAVWRRHCGGDKEANASSILYDTVAVHLAFSRQFLTVESMGVDVTDDGFTVRSPSGPKLDVAMAWTDLDGYLDFLVERMTAPTIPAAGTR